MGFAEKLMIHGECSRFEEKEKPPDSVLLLLPGVGTARILLWTRVLLFPKRALASGGCYGRVLPPHRHVDMTCGVLQVLRRIAPHRQLTTSGVLQQVGVAPDRSEAKGVLQKKTLSEKPGSSALELEDSPVLPSRDILAYWRISVKGSWNYWLIERIIYFFRMREDTVYWKHEYHDF